MNWNYEGLYGIEIIKSYNFWQIVNTPQIFQKVSTFLRQEMTINFRNQRISLNILKYTLIFCINIFKDIPFTKMMEYF